MDIIDAVKHIQSLSEVFVDHNFGQGRDLVLKQLNQRTGEDESAWVDVFIEDSQNAIPELTQKVMPYDIPDDYIFFLEYYGGLLIWRDKYSFSVLGIGPMVEEWYAAIDSDEAFPEAGKYGFLSLGSLNFGEGKYKFQYVDFFFGFGR